MLAISTILIVERELLCRSGLASIVQSGIPDCRIETSDTLDHARAWLDSTPGRVLLVMGGGVDLDANDAGGLSSLRSRYPLLSLVVMDWSRDRQVALRAIADGAHGYIPKDLEQDELLHAFKLVMSGQVYVPPTVGHVDGDNMVGKARATSIGALTGRQREVLTHMSMGKSNKEIAYSLRISESTVKVHVAAAFRQLGVHNRVGAVAVLQSRSGQRDLIFDEAIRGFGQRIDEEDLPRRAFG